jgi:signal peptidase II
MNKWKKSTLIIVTLSIIVIGVAADLLLKAFFEGLEGEGALPYYLFGTVGFVWRENAGGAWSILEGFGGKNILFFILTLLGVPLFLALLVIGRKKSVVGIIGYSAAISGTLGNAFDRLTRGEKFYSGRVRDFLSIGNWFPVFNVADMLLVGGVVCIILAILFFDDDSFLVSLKKEKEKRKNENKAGD